MYHRFELIVCHSIHKIAGVEEDRSGIGLAGKKFPDKCWNGGQRRA